MVNSYSEVFTRFKKKLQERSKPSEVIWKNSRSAARIVITEQNSILAITQDSGDLRSKTRTKRKQKGKKS